MIYPFHCQWFTHLPANDLRTSSIPHTKIWESPQIAQAHGVADTHEQELRLVTPVTTHFVLISAGGIAGLQTNFNSFWIYLRKYNAFSMISQQWDGTNNLNPSSWNKLILHCEWHGCWWPGGTWSQVIYSHGNIPISLPDWSTLQMTQDFARSCRSFWMT